MEIKSLLYDRNFTIKGAQQHLKHSSLKQTQSVDKMKIIKLSDSTDIQTFKRLKQGLDDLIKLIEEFKDQY